MSKQCIDCGKAIPNRRRCKTCQSKNLYFGGLYWQVIKRDGGKCVECGIKNDGPRKVNVHHKDHNPKNNTPENLETLCINCHKKKRVFSCVDCGEKVVATSAKQKRCLECGKKHNKKMEAKRMIVFYTKHPKKYLSDYYIVFYKKVLNN